MATAVKQPKQTERKGKLSRILVPSISAVFCAVRREFLIWSQFNVSYLCLKVK